MLRFTSRRSSFVEETHRARFAHLPDRGLRLDALESTVADRFCTSSELATRSDHRNRIRSIPASECVDGRHGRYSRHRAPLHHDDCHAVTRHYGGRQRRELKRRSRPAHARWPNSDQSPPDYSGPLILPAPSGTTRSPNRETRLEIVSIGCSVLTNEASAPMMRPSPMQTTR